jgi:hypothetical protein
MILGPSSKSSSRTSPTAAVLRIGRSTVILSLSKDGCPPDTTLFDWRLDDSTEPVDGSE